jgi:lactosylceramide 4-alpha-galactosyltransferase
MKVETRKHRIVEILTILALILLLIVYLALPKDQTTLIEISRARSLDFDDILSSNFQPENGKNVFFVESGNSEGNVTLKIRQACSIESAALVNPHLKIFVLFTSHQRLQNLTKTPEVEAILSYPNVYFNSIDVDKFSIGTPFEEFFARKVLKTSAFKVVHESDVVRIMVLWRFGGSYIDTDIIVRQKLDSTPPNYACPESETHINNAAINFQSISDNFLVETFAFDLIRNFNGQSWGGNGPMMMTRVLKQLCNTNSTKEMVEKGNCKSFHVLKKETCYLVGGMQSALLFTDSKGDEIIEALKNSIVVHFWNSATKAWKLRKNQTAAYVQLAWKFCPKVMAQTGDEF